MLNQIQRVSLGSVARIVGLIAFAVAMLAMLATFRLNN